MSKETETYTAYFQKFGISFDNAEIRYLGARHLR